MTAPTTQAEQEDAVREEPPLHSFCINPVSGPNIRAEGTDRFTTEAEAFAYVAWSRAAIGTLSAERDQLAADLRKAREEDRRAIATATKSSDQILLYGNLKGSPERAWYIGKWFRCGSYGGGWWVSSSVEVEATHWSPLPSPPALTPDPKDAGGTAKGEDHGA